MNLLKTPQRRLGALVASGAIGLIGAVAFAGPASAHYPSAAGSSSCINEDGSWTIDWSVGNDYNLDATVTEAVAAQGKTTLPVTGALTADGTIVPANSDNNAGIQIHGTTVVPGSKTVEGRKHDKGSVTLTVILKWTDGYTNDGQGSDRAPLTVQVAQPTEKCTPTTPPSSAPPSSAPAPSDSASTAPSSPAPSTSATTPGIPVPTPSSSSEPGEPSLNLAYYCDAMVFDIKNPANGIDFSVDFVSSPTGDKRHDDVKPGSEVTEKFAADSKTSVKITSTVVVDGKTYTDFETYAYKKPAGCTSGSGSTLPLTGPAAGGIAGGAAVLLAAGAGVFVMARRRKVRFTA